MTTLLNGDLCHSNTNSPALQDSTPPSETPSEAAPAPVGARERRAAQTGLAEELLRQLSEERRERARHLATLQERLERQEHELTEVRELQMDSSHKATARERKELFAAVGGIHDDMQTLRTHFASLQTSHDGTAAKLVSLESAMSESGGGGSKVEALESTVVEIRTHLDQVRRAHADELHHIRRHIGVKDQRGETAALQDRANTGQGEPPPEPQAGLGDASLEVGQDQPEKRLQKMDGRTSQLDAGAGQELAVPADELEFLRSQVKALWQASEATADKVAELEAAVADDGLGQQLQLLGEEIQQLQQVATSKEVTTSKEVDEVRAILEVQAANADLMNQISILTEAEGVDRMRELAGHRAWEELQNVDRLVRARDAETESSKLAAQLVQFDLQTEGLRSRIDRLAASHAELEAGKQQFLDKLAEVHARQEELAKQVDSHIAQTQEATSTAQALLQEDAARAKDMAELQHSVRELAHSIEAFPQVELEQREVRKSLKDTFAELEKLRQHQEDQRRELAELEEEHAQRLEDHAQTSHNTVRLIQEQHARALASHVQASQDVQSMHEAEASALKDHLRDAQSTVEEHRQDVQELHKLMHEHITSSQALQEQQHELTEVKASLEDLKALLVNASLGRPSGGSPPRSAREGLDPSAGSDLAAVRALQEQHARMLAEHGRVAQAALATCDAHETDMAALSRQVEQLCQKVDGLGRVDNVSVSTGRPASKFQASTEYDIKTLRGWYSSLADQLRDLKSELREQASSFQPVDPDSNQYKSPKQSSWWA